MRGCCGGWTLAGRDFNTTRAASAVGGREAAKPFLTERRQGGRLPGLPSRVSPVPALQRDLELASLLRSLHPSVDKMWVDTRSHSQFSI